MNPTKSAIPTILAMVLLPAFTAMAAPASASTPPSSVAVEVREYPSSAEGVVTIRGLAAFRMYEVMAKNGLRVASPADTREVLQGPNMGCYVESREPARVGRRIVERKNYACSFILFDGSTEPNTTQGVGPNPGITAGN